MPFVSKETLILIQFTKFFPTEPYKKGKNLVCCILKMFSIYPTIFFLITITMAAKVLHLKLALESDPRSQHETNGLHKTLVVGAREAVG